MWFNFEMYHGDGMGKRDKAGKFVELATKRVNRAINDLRLISNLSNRNNYDYTDEQAKKIVRTLQKEIDLVKSNFDQAANSAKKEFRL